MKKGKRERNGLLVSFLILEGDPFYIWKGEGKKGKKKREGVSLLFVFFFFSALLYFFPFDLDVFLLSLGGFGNQSFFCL